MTACTERHAQARAQMLADEGQKGMRKVGTA